MVDFAPMIIVAVGILVALGVLVYLMWRTK